MKNLKTAFIIASAIMAAVLTTGCVASEITLNPYANGPIMVQPEGEIELDHDQIIADCSDALCDDDEYQYVDYLDMVINEEEGYVELIMPLTSDAPIDIAKDYAKQYIRAFNDACATQDFNYELSTPDYYGGYWDTHDCYILVFRNCDILDHDSYYVAQHIPAGSNDPIVIYQPTGEEEEFLQAYGTGGIHYEEESAEEETEAAEE